MRTKSIPIFPQLVVFLFSGNPELVLHLSAFVMYWVHSFDCICDVRLALGSFAAILVDCGGSIRN